MKGKSLPRSRPQDHCRGSRRVAYPASTTLLQFFHSSWKPPCHVELLYRLVDLPHLVIDLQRSLARSMQGLSLYAQDATDLLRLRMLGMSASAYRFYSEP